jgi:hypothetical protein
VTNTLSATVISNMKREGTEIATKEEIKDESRKRLSLTAKERDELKKMQKDNKEPVSIIVREGNI